MIDKFQSKRTIPGEMIENQSNVVRVPHAVAALAAKDARLTIRRIPDLGDSFLADTDPSPVEAVRLDGRAPFVLLCEHAGNAIPSCLAGLGLAAEELDRHIGWDIGAAEVTRRLSAMLDAPALLQRYSRLVIDCNRPRRSPALIPTDSDGTSIPFNANLSATERYQRWAAIHRPFHELAGQLLDRRTISLLVTIHSFTPRPRSGPIGDRSMHMGLLHGPDVRLARAVASDFDDEGGAVCLAFNAPYTVEEESDYAIPVHGLARNIPNLLVEIRQDLIDTPEGQKAWARRLHRALGGPAVSRLIQEINA